MRSVFKDKNYYTISSIQYCISYIQIKLLAEYFGNMINTELQYCNQSIVDVDLMLTVGVIPTYSLNMIYIKQQFSL